MSLGRQVELLEQVVQVQRVHRQPQGSADQEKARVLVQVPLVPLVVLVFLLNLLSNP